MVELFQNIGNFVVDQWNEIHPWKLQSEAVWKGFWLKQVFSYTSQIVYFLPLVPILMLLKGRALKIGIVTTCLVFLTYLFGPLYAAFWIALCLLFYRLTEQFTIEIKRTDVWRHGPTVAAILFICAIILVNGILQLGWLGRPILSSWEPAWAKFHESFWWLYPLHFRGVAWEASRIGDTLNLFNVTFGMPHLIGTAYLMVRMTHYFSELKKETIPAEHRTPLNFLAFCCYAPAVMQGPVERYQRYFEEIETCHERRTWQNIFPAFWRFALGLSKFLVAAIVIAPYSQKYLKIVSDGSMYFSHPEQISNYLVLYSGVFTEILVLFLLFSGYCDFGAGMSRLIGYRIIENFNRPYLAVNLRDFWARWHISLSLILRDYVYFAIGGSRPASGRRSRIIFNVCFTFFLCGIWHAPNPKFGLWGILMGLMVIGSQIRHRTLKKIDESDTTLGKIRRAWLKLKPIPTIMSWFITMNIFCFSLLIFFGAEGGVRVFWELVRRPLNVVLPMMGIDAVLPSMNEMAGQTM